HRRLPRLLRRPVQTPLQYLEFHRVRYPELLMEAVELRPRPQPCPRRGCTLAATDPRLPATRPPRRRGSRVGHRRLPAVAGTAAPSSPVRIPVGLASARPTLRDLLHILDHGLRVRHQRLAVEVPDGAGATEALKDLDDRGRLLLDRLLVHPLGLGRGLRIGP